jgi:hypothetical protein
LEFCPVVLIIIFIINYSEREIIKFHKRGDKMGSWEVESYERDSKPCAFGLGKINSFIEILGHTKVLHPTREGETTYILDCPNEN